ncbi:MAG: bifunctional 23S rRNA (guanine(2069)-N(7))-methyltransferase RlmK/23S rRNA (guanine(2445)-N(2))-methyltransferase RlmL [Paraglaciecola sp.]|uniref:bifunctional 23S rRNA (guanine(2069)-N(7))-methyltransferase RlmK/23S rRNA (guanine(2445)-N(2))-methyltransferase RlmL n=1 Tax=Paraglaciecola sp. TaxID=1920173 RepID=UPI00273D71BA|nr:bifunctional 23S rRNA (guanine(2069)-N(7))-methyltransferase RlmK/23S rRNA (guanine(2445)-N(2))-methyltransferase RlmL [Paraglaciecola sp.]MDP5031103.1 bifunctional 23S rRNA (guanine(2069)-N(7))-methyltransferase RlmK/23S rRNA (guanine(2445)-N(2))-methyltransferase RlmL [Paraglaciecola sp.]MDP5040423.1 bifunctional 23S rRNA (guanine(2069)-N(7))-methyltransferase RlmK/23S rRNA (guanine(2445)-N(2))-methyltransferase RlmL [Paraglaciecola sp.]MDP5132413.1 bifunctional 23S rRNA (guanine(2069)-N(7)
MFEFLITAAKGLDELLLEELSAICPDSQLKSKPGQVLMFAGIEDAYKVCLWSRLANRVLLKLSEGDVKQADDLYQIADQVNWPTQFSTNNTFVVDFNGTNQQINNTQFGALKIKDAIVDQFATFFDERPSVSKIAPDIRIHARLWRDKLTVYLDLSGRSLHQRHYRSKTGLAPVKEHIACAMLIRSGWTKNQQLPLIDPMCGAGTIVIEAALMAANIAPGLKREVWGFTHWKQHQASIWQALLISAEQAVIAPAHMIYANDIDMGVLALAKENAHNAQVYDFIQFSHQDVRHFKITDAAPGYIVSNPPYGERLGDTAQLFPLFQQWGAWLKAHFLNWQMSLLTSNRDLLRQMKLNAKKEYQLMNGKLECQLVNYVLDEQNCQEREVKLIQNDFVNRLGKNLARSKKWLKSQNTNCYRLYDADLPEYNVAIDCYADWLVVQEYAAPKNVPEHVAKRRLHEIVAALPQVTQIKPDHIMLKVREQQKGKNQYQKVAQTRQTIDVYENGAQFKVNLKDYLDTGLFLDHRITRQLVQQKSKGKDVLNLFAYTGSVSVHAALGGAKSVTTVDMSNTYIEWAKENFQLNKLKGAYQFEQADCLTWLSQHKQKYDLIFIDPPSFSNSKRMESTWDVQRDYLNLIKDAVTCLNTNGNIFFSNNLRQFKLDEEAVSALGLKVSDITKQTIPEDFQRNPKIHHCWLFTKES